MSVVLARVVPIISALITSIFLEVFFYLFGIFFLTSGILKLFVNPERIKNMYLASKIIDADATRTYNIVTGIFDLLFSIGILLPMFSKTEIISWGAILVAAIYMLILIIIGKTKKSPINITRNGIVLVLAVIIPVITWSMALNPSVARSFEAVASIKRATVYWPMEIQWAEQHQAPEVGEMAPDFELTDYNGENPFRLSDYRGKKPVALIFGTYT